MLNFLKQEANRTFTENGAVTNRSTGSELLDLFATVGALRRENEQEITDRFLRAWTEDKDLALKLLFYARDVRGGLGERRVFRAVLRWLAVNEPRSLVKNLPLIPEYGRWDDVGILLDTPVKAAAVSVIKEQLSKDLEAMKAEDGSVSLLGKWLPSINAHNEDTVRLGRLLAKELGLSEREYRKTLSALRERIRILENNLREKDYSFDYAKQPAKAMFKYRKAFARNDRERYTEFLQRVQKGETKLHTGTLLPYELVDSWLTNSGRYRMPSPEEALTLNTTWAALEDFAADDNALAVVDSSGSMYGWSSPKPASVALSLGLYFAERAKGPYRNHFIEFSAHPELIELKGETFVEKLRYISAFNEIANTNLEAVFDLILSTAVKNRVPQEELPRKLYIISDMEFDACMENASATVFENARKRYAKHGYELPQIVFWNVQSRNRQQPVTMNDRGVALVSGCSPRIFSMAMEGILDPYAFMLSVLNAERYAPISA
ncbi:MAG: DUF2828 family protein [Oscillospiraceae bacterium]|nr:DUF2828 family protein [Oscillospiraceae bacterium]